MADQPISSLTSTNYSSLLPPACLYFHRCLSVHGGVSVFAQRGSPSRGGLRPGGSLSSTGLCPAGSLSSRVSVWSLCLGVSVQAGGSLSRQGDLCPGGLCPGGSLSRGSLFRQGISVQGVSVRGPPYCNELHILPPSCLCFHRCLSVHRGGGRGESQSLPRGSLSRGVFV